MILKTPLIKQQANKIKIGDIHELEIEIIGSKKIITYLVEIKGGITEERCSSCNIRLKEKVEFGRSIYCFDCAKKRREEVSKKNTGHIQAKNAFGGYMHGEKWR